MDRVHGTTVAFRDAGRWRAVLLRGPSGAGKSDLALRLIETGARLVADDQTELESFESQLLASAPATLAGRIEVRGIGIIEQPYLERAALVLVCDLCAPEQISRIPSPETVVLAGHDLPLLRIAPFESSAPIKVRLGLEAIRRGIVG